MRIAIQLSFTCVLLGCIPLAHGGNEKPIHLDKTSRPINGLERGTPGQQPSDRQNAVKFIRDNIIGRPVHYQSIVKIDNGKLEVDFTRTMTFCNLAETARGFTFDLCTNIKQTNYDLSKEGQRTGDGQTKDRLVVIRYEVMERRSTDKLVGSKRPLANTLEDPIGSVELIQEIRCDGSNLRIRRSTVGYDDFFTKGGSHKPGAEEAEEIFTVIDGLLQHSETGQHFDVDPVTFRRTASGQPFTLTSKQKR